MSLEAGHAYVVSIALRRLDLGPGSYVLDLALKREDGTPLDERSACVRIEVLPAQTEAPDAPAHHVDITTRPVFDWTLAPI
jgi:hypothetical protein